MKVTPEIVENFATALLMPNYDNPSPVPQFHRELWEMCCSNRRFVAIAAPREHAKTTAVTHAYLLTCLLYREHDFAVIVSDTEGQAAQFLAGIKADIHENRVLQEMFGVSLVQKDSETEFVVKFNDGHKFKVMARGSEQKLRGMIWRNKRPNIVIVDDAENDEIVMNQDRRDKFRRWVMRAMIPMGAAKKCKFRWVGTVLHFDSMLERLLTGNPKNNHWLSKRYRAHNEDFSEILWPERYSKQDLLDIRARFEAAGDPDGYSSEYLNEPINTTDAYFRMDDLLPMSVDDRNRRKVYYAAADLAISKDSQGKYSAIVVAGRDEKGSLHIVDVRRGKWDSYQIVEELLSVQKAFAPEIFTVEKGTLEKAIGPYLEEQMRVQQVFMSLTTPAAVNDKVQRGKSIQGRIKARSVFFDTEASWWPTLQDEMIKFPKGRFSDQVDCLAWIGLSLANMSNASSDEEIDTDDYTYMIRQNRTGRSMVTGY